MTRRTVGRDGCVAFEFSWSFLRYADRLPVSDANQFASAGRGPALAGSGRATQLPLPQPMQPQRQLQLEGAVGGVPVGAEEFGDAVEALGDGVDVDVEAVLGAHEVAAAGEVGLQRSEQFRGAARVVVDDRAEGALDEAGDVAAAEEEADEAQVAGARGVADAAQGQQGAEAVFCFGVELRGSEGAVARARRRSPPRPVPPDPR